MSNLMYMIICLNPNVIYSMHIKEDKKISTYSIFNTPPFRKQ